MEPLEAVMALVSRDGGVDPDPARAMYRVAGVVPELHHLTLPTERSLFFLRRRRRGRLQKEAGPHACSAVRSRSCTMLDLSPPGRVSAVGVQARPAGARETEKGGPVPLDALALEACATCK